MTIPSKDKHLTNYNMAASIRSLIARDEVLSFGDPVMGTCCFHTKILISIKIPYLILYRHDDVLLSNNNHVRFKDNCRAGPNGIPRS